MLEEIQPFVIWGPAHDVDEAWDITFLKIDYRGQRIELGDSSSNPRFFSARYGRWETQHIDYANHTTAEVFGIEVMPRRELINYKPFLGRAVDLIDISAG